MVEVDEGAATLIVDGAALRLTVVDDVGITIAAGDDGSTRAPAEVDVSCNGGGLLFTPAERILELVAVAPGVPPPNAGEVDPLVLDILAMNPNYTRNFGQHLII